MAEKINLTFLGTGSAVPTKRRNHPAILLQYKDENILVDCGEGTQRQFRIAGLNPCSLTRVLISHWHGDHVLGLPGLLQTLMLNGYQKTLHIYGPRGTQKMLSLYLGLFVHQEKISIQVHEIPAPGKIIEAKDFYIQAEAMQHETPALAYSFIIKEKNRLDKKKLAKLKLPNSSILKDLQQGKTIDFQGKKISGKNLIYKENQRKITFIMDTLPCKGCVSLADGSDILISECTYSKEEKELAQKHAHMTSEDVANIAKKSKVKQLILIHLSQRYENAPKIILSEVKKIFKNAKIAEDFDKISI